MRNPHDICAARHGGDANSRDAHRRLAGDLPRLRLYVLLAIRAEGRAGLTCAELALRWDCGMNAISGRFSELLRDGLVRRDGRRGRGWVHVAAD
jgi:hypothetical protein